MSILFHIFVVLIGFNMTTKENINVPGATAILTLRVETDKPFAEGTPYYITMETICKNCGDSFIPTSSRKIFCSDRCYKKQRRKGHKLSTEKLIHCYDNIYKIPYIRSNGKCSNHYLIKTKCLVCGKEFYRDKSNARKTDHSLCSIGCKAIFQTNDLGHQKFKRGKGKGSLQSKMPNHPYCDNKGFVATHRLIVEKRIGRFLKEEEIVHHIDIVNTNNEDSNLFLCSGNIEHLLIHASLNKCVAELIKIGVLKFNQESKKYQVNNL